MRTADVFRTSNSCTTPLSKPKATTASAKFTINDRVQAAVVKRRMNNHLSPTDARPTRTRVRHFSQVPQGTTPPGTEVKHLSQGNPSYLSTKCLHNHLLAVGAFQDQVRWKTIMLARSRDKLIAVDTTVVSSYTDLTCTAEHQVVRKK